MIHVRSAGRRVLLLLTSLLLVLGPTLVAPGPALAQNCQFVLGFQSFHSLIPAIIGGCLTNETHNGINGDGLQPTTNGLLVWRKASNTMAFTNGSTSWVFGPFGLQVRPNDQRFPWEPDATLPMAQAFLQSQGFLVADPGVYNGGARLNVLIGIKTPAASGTNQQAFFFSNGHFLGTDTSDTSAGIRVVSESNDTVTLAYRLYHPSDPMCCPTAGEATVRFSFPGGVTGVTPLDPIPASTFQADPSRR
jgi:hypothetical protein